jgi:4-amino-4-deoxy-L-arabinose transferase-like glycosyltransferase
LIVEPSKSTSTEITVSIILPPPVSVAQEEPRFGPEGTVVASPDHPGAPEDCVNDSWKVKLRQGAILIALALTLNLAGNSRTSLWDRDEPRYATCTREMRASGDFIHPTFNGEPRYQKPVLIYWLMLIGTAIAGDNPFGARLISSLMGAASCVLTWVLGRRLLGPRVGFLAALMLTTAPLMVIESKLATTDATLGFLIVGCQFALWELGKRASRPAAIAFWICAALATLTKGPVCLAFIGASGLVSWIFGGPRVSWSRLEWKWGIPFFALITLPWYVAIGFVSQGEFYREAMGFQILKRVATGIEEHGGFPGYYVVTSLLTLHPWSALLPAALLAAWAKRKNNPAMGFLLGWTIGPLILFECVRTKLVHYYLPAVPACAMLAAWLVLKVSAAEMNLRRWPLGRVSLGLLTGVAIALTVALLAGVVVFPWSLRGPCLVMALVVAAGTLLSIERFYSGRTEPAAYGLVATWAIVLFVGGAWLLPATEPYRISRRVAERLGALADEEGALPMLATFQQPSVIYTMNRIAPIIHDRAAFYERVRTEGAVVTALMAHEFDSLNEDPRGILEPRDFVEGFNIDKGRRERLRIVVVRPPEVVSRIALGIQQSKIQ